jgi:hypothetical protein
MFNRQLALQLIDVEIKRCDAIIDGNITVGLDEEQREVIAIVYSELRADLYAKRRKTLAAIALEERAAEQQVDLMRGK